MHSRPFRCRVLATVFLSHLLFSLAAIAQEEVVLESGLYHRMRSATTAQVQGGLVLKSFRFPDGKAVDLHFRAINIWSAGAEIHHYRDGELQEVRAPRSGPRFVAEGPGSGEEQGGSYWAFASFGTTGVVTMSLQVDDFVYRYGSSPEAPRTLILQEILPQLEPPEDDEFEPTEALASLEPPLDIENQDRVRIGHLGAEIAVAVDNAVIDGLVSAEYAGAAATVGEHVEHYIADLFAYLNTPFRRDLQVSLTVAFLVIYEGPDEPWQRWTSDLSLVSYARSAKDIFRARWNATLGGIPAGDAAIMLNAPAIALLPDGTPDPGQGSGAAAVGWVCDSREAYAVANVRDFGMPENADGQSNTSFDNKGYFTIAHEIGHLLGGLHMLDLPLADGDSALPNRCDSVFSEWQNAIGTTMSVCRQRMDGFHPRNQAWIRQVVERRACLEPLPYPITEMLTNNTPVSGLAADNGYSRRFQIEVPQLAEDLLVETGGSGALSLLLVKDFEIRGESGSADAFQSLRIAAPEAGVWDVWLIGQSSFANVNLRASYVTPSRNGWAEVGLAAQGVPLTGALAAINSNLFHWQIPQDTTRLVIETRASQLGPACGVGQDADLYAQPGVPPAHVLPFGPDVVPYRSKTADCSAELLEIQNPQPGPWYAAVYAAQDYQDVLFRATWDTPLRAGAGSAFGGSNSRGPATGDSFLFRFDVPTSATRLDLELEAFVIHNAQSQAVVDAYLRLDDTPDSNLWDETLFAYTHLSPSNLTLSPVASGTWYANVRPSGEVNGLRFRAAHDGGQGATVIDRVPLPSLANDIGSVMAGNPLWFRLAVPGTFDLLNVRLEGGSGNADLYVVQGPQPPSPTLTDPANSTWDGTSAGLGTVEQVDLSNPIHGDYFILLHPQTAFSGVTLTASLNLNPYFDAGSSGDYLYVPQAAAVGSAVPLAVLAMDDDGDPLTYTWDFGDGSMPFTGDLSQGGHEPEHVYTVAGTYNVRVTVSDGFPMGEVSESRSITIHQGPPPPTLPILQSLTVPSVAMVGQSIALSAVATEPNGAPLTYDWKLIHSSGVEVTAQGASVPVTLNHTGSWTVRVRIEGPGGVIEDGAIVMVS